MDFLRQLLSTWTAPALETANYTVLRWGEGGMKEGCGEEGAGDEAGGR